MHFFEENFLNSLDFMRESKWDKNPKFFHIFSKFYPFIDVEYLIKISLALALELMKMGGKNVKKIIGILGKESVKGSTITELVKTSRLSRHIVLKTLAQLEGADKVSIRNVGMAKIYSLKTENEDEKEKKWGEKEV